MTITEFLLARITEDAAVAWEFHNMDCDSVGAVPFPCTCRHEKRVLAECAAKRRIVDDATNQHTSCAELDEVVRILASVYADHPDFDPSWTL